MSRIEVIPRLDDPIWRIQNLYLIRDKKARVTHLDFNKIQDLIHDRLIDDIKAGRPLDLSILKFRQGGVSTLFSLLHLDRTIFNPNLRTGILADLWKNLGYLFEIVRFAHESMPDGLKPKKGDDTKYAMSFPEIGSRIFVDLEIKSTTIHGLHISEHAHMDEEEVQRTIGACTPGAWVTSETTANGRNFFHRRWRTLKAEGRKTLFLPWPLQEEYRIPSPGDPDDLPPVIKTEEEIRLAERMKNQYGIEMDDRQFRYRRKIRSDSGFGRIADQEMAEDEDACFISTGGAFFNGRKMGVLMDEAVSLLKKEPAIREDEYEIVFEEPTTRCIYAAGADIAEGIETGADKDYSVLCILCVTHRSVAYRFRARVAVDTFYRHCSKKCTEYNRALFAPEVNGTYGGSMVTGLKDVCKYMNLYFEDKETRVIKNKNSIKRVYGWETTGESKPLMLTQLRLALEGKSEEDENNFAPEFLVLDTKFLAETFMIIQEGAKIYAKEGHDDVVMAYAIAYQVYRKLRGAGAGYDRIRFGGNLQGASEKRNGSSG